MIKNFLIGLGDVKKGWSYLMTHKGLLKILIIPTIINLLLFCFLIYFLIHSYGDLYGWIADRLGGLKVHTDAWWGFLVKGILWFVRVVIRFLLGAILLVLVVLASLFISEIINSPFYDILSEAVEERVMGIKGIPFSLRRFFVEAWRSIVVELKKILFFVFGSLLLMFLHFIPMVGSLIYAFSANLFAAWDMGFNYVSFAMCRKLIPFKTQLAFCSQHKARLVGMGVVLLIPFLNILLAPIFVVGGTLMYLEVNALEPENNNSHLYIEKSG